MKARRIFKKVLWIVLLVIILAIIAAIIVNSAITPTALSLAQSQSRSLASSAIYQGVRESIRDVSYNDLIIVQYDERGRVAMVQADSIRMNRLASDASTTAQGIISSIDSREISVPVGTALGGSLFAGRGPVIPVRVVPVGSVVTEFETNFSSAGINQTRHEIALIIRARMQIVIPAGTEATEIMVRIPVAETVIVGEPPSSYQQLDLDDEPLNLIP